MNALAKIRWPRVFNTNGLDTGSPIALKETSVYYSRVRPEHAAQASGKFRRIAVTVPSRRDLTVRVRQGFYDVEPAANNKRSKENESAKRQSCLRPCLRRDGRPFTLRRNAGAVTLTYWNMPNKKNATHEFHADENRILVSYLTGTNGKQSSTSKAPSMTIRVTGARALRQTDNHCGTVDQALRRARTWFITYRFTWRPASIKCVSASAMTQWENRTVTNDRDTNLASHKLIMSSLIAGERTAHASSATAAPQNEMDRAPFACGPSFPS